MFPTCSFSANIFFLLQQMEARRHEEVIGVLAGNAELGGGAQRAGWGRHGQRRRRRRERVGAAAVAQRVGGASEQSDALTLAFL